MSVSFVTDGFKSYHVNRNSFIWIEYLVFQGLWCHFYSRIQNIFQQCPNNRFTSKTVQPFSSPQIFASMIG